MLKPFTREGRFESGMDEIVNRKRWAFVAVIGDNYGARLGVAIEGERGYLPIPEFWCHADSLDDLQAHADDLNSREGLDQRAAAEIVCSTMR